MLDGSVNAFASSFFGAFPHGLTDVGGLVPNHEHNDHEHYCHRESAGEVFHEVSPDAKG
jgi:hypothetical protein